MNLFVGRFGRLILPVALLATLPSLDTAVGGYSDTAETVFAIVEAGESSQPGSDDKEIKQSKVKIRLCIPTLLELSASRARISFEKIDGPGVYDGDRVIALFLTTNTTDWRVLCDTAILSVGDGTPTDLPLERVRWKLTSIQPEPIEASGVLAPGVTFLEGHAPVMGLEASISFSLEILPTDIEPAAAYNLKISLIGSVNDD